MGAAKAIPMFVMDSNIAILRVAFGDLDDFGDLLVLIVGIVVTGMITDFTSSGVVATLNGVGDIIWKAIESYLERDAVVVIARLVSLEVRLVHKSKVLTSFKGKGFRI